MIAWRAAVFALDAWFSQAHATPLDLDWGSAQAPDVVPRSTGACGAGLVAVYRVWNGRADSNHRYTTSKALRDQMAARGYVAEGYGPDAVIACAPAV